MARQQYERSRRAYNLGDYEEALSGFDRAYRDTGDPALLFNIAQCHRQLGHIQEALRTYRTFLREVPRAPNRAAVEAQIKELEEKLAKEGPAPARAAATTPPPAVDSPKEVTPPSLAPAAAAPSTPPEPAAPAAADQRSAPVPSTEPAPAETGPATAEPTRPVLAAPLEAPTRNAMDYPGSAAASRSAPPRRGRWLPWAGVGLTAALAGAAVITGLWATSRFNSLESHCGQTPEGCSNSDVNVVRARAFVTNVLWGATGAAALGTGIAFIMMPRESSGALVAWSHSW